MSDIQRPPQIGRYATLDQLATGGMAVVYLAIECGEHGLNRPVVIKQVLPQFDDEPTMRRMLLQEARLAARVTHPNVVEIHELGEDDGRPFIAMEYVPGVSLREVLIQAHKLGKEVPIGVAIGLAMQACAGAHAAHELRDPSGEFENLVHRDLSPHNLVVTGAGLLKVLDFGVAKAAFNPDKTQTGMLKGKFSYMSPEQLNQSDLDRRSDVFSLGVVLWESVALRPLFRRDSEISTMQAVLDPELPDMNGIRANVPKQLMAIIERALARDRDRRYANADQFRRDLSNTARDLKLVVSSDAVGDYVNDLLGDLLTDRQRYVDELVSWGLTQFKDNPPKLHDVDTIVKPVPGPQSLSGVGPQQTQPTLLAPAPKQHAVWAILAISLLVAAAALVVALKATGPSAAPQEEPEAHTVPEGKPIVVALAPTMDSSQLHTQLEPLRLYLERTIDRPVAFEIPRDYGATAELIKGGRVPFAVLPPLLYVKTKLSYDPLRLVVVKLHSGSDGYDGILVIRNDAGIQTTADLAGKRMCYADTDSTSGYFMPRAFLRAQGIDPDTIFSKVRISGNHQQVMRDLDAGLCDVGGTANDFYAQADEVDVSTARTRVLAITGRAPHDVFVASEVVTDEDLAVLRDALLNFDPKRDAGLDRIGELERISGFATVDDQVYDDLRTLYLASLDSP